MENNALQIFDFEGKQVRFVIDKGTPLFTAKDVVEGVGSVWNGEAAISHVPEEWKVLRLNLTTFGEKETWYLLEQGIYFYLSRSNKAAALPFQKKVAGEILPSIREFGVYMTPKVIEETLTDPDFIIRLATKLKDEQEKNATLVEQTKALAAKIEDDHPKVLFADSVKASNTSILIGDLAKLICQNGVDIGQKRLFKWLRDHGYLMKNTCSKNMPTQKSMDSGWFEVKESTVNNPDGTIRIIKTTKVTGRGQVYFVNLFLGDPKDSPNLDPTGEAA
jgi:anti-repressor protein